MAVSCKGCIVATHSSVLICLVSSSAVLDSPSFTFSSAFFAFSSAFFAFSSAFPAPSMDSFIDLFIPANSFLISWIDCISEVPRVLTYMY
ncbi:hypothetical protein HOY82DRAFT_549958 [Tuber indicum]|nr:hypothetical protein HOY82DRAFT_549958 [Tuber indicum]